MQTFIASTTHFGSVLNPFTFNKNQCIKLPKFEVDMPLSMSSRGNINPATNTQQRHCLSETDVIMGCIYGEYYVIVIRQMVQEASIASAKQAVNSNRAYSEIVMYKLGGGKSS